MQQRFLQSHVLPLLRWTCREDSSSCVCRKICKTAPPSQQHGIGHEACGSNGRTAYTREGSTHESSCKDF